MHREIVCHPGTPSESTGRLRPLLIYFSSLQLCIASIVQKFDLSLVNPSYTLELKQALTIKPKDLRIRAALRTTGRRLSASPSTHFKSSGLTVTPVPTTNGATIPLYVLYGSNTGTSEAFAQRIVGDAPSYGQSCAMDFS